MSCAINPIRPLSFLFVKSYRLGCNARRRHRECFASRSSILALTRLSEVALKEFAVMVVVEDTPAFAVMSPAAVRVEFAATCPEAVIPAPLSPPFAVMSPVAVSVEFAAI